MVAEKWKVAKGRASSLILASKLRRPAVAAGPIPRPRLLHRLDAGLPLNATLIAAPAGYGKSVLASQWLEQLGSPSAWLSLEAGDGDLTLFLTSITAAIRAVFPEALPQTDRLARGRHTPPERELTTLLLNELDLLPTRMVLVLDDYHHVSSEPVNHLLATILRHPPRGLHPVILSRFDPLLPLAELRAQGLLGEIREHDLRFTRREIEELLESELGVPVASELVAAIERRTEGWPVGLRLGLESQRYGGDPAALARNAAGPFDDEHVHRFLASEVVAAQPDRLRWAFLAMSVLDRFCAPLCDALLAEGEAPADLPTGREVIDWLARHNLFVVSLGGEGEWYRYHHLFQGLLRTLLERERGSDAVAALHRRAGEWLADNGWIDEALDHLLAAGDTAGAARIVVRHGNALLDEGNWPQLKHWIGRIPRECADQDAGLLSLEAWIKVGAESQVREVALAVERVDALLADDSGRADAAELRGSLAALRGYLTFADGDARGSLRLADRGLELIPSDRKRQRALVAALRIVSIQATGDYRAALSAAEDVTLDDGFRGNRLRPWEFGRAHAAWLETDLGTLRAAGGNLLARGEQEGLVELAAAGRYFLGIDRYQRNDLVGAEAILAPLVGESLDSRSDYAVQGLAALAFTRLALGRPDDAWASTEMLTGYAAERGDPFLLTFAHTLQADLDLRQGRLARATRWVEWYRPQIRQPWAFYAPVVTAAKALLATKTAAALDRAADLLGRQLELSERLHNRAVLIPLLGLRALVSDAQGDGESAMAALGRAVSLSQPSGAVRFLADLGPDLVPLLIRIEAAGEELEHAGLILAAILGRSGAAASVGVRPALALPEVRGVEGLTEREAAVLALLARRYSNKEIARDLFISPATVKKHTVALYRKLHVAGRHEAVQKSTALGYLPDDPDGDRSPAWQD